MNSILKRLGYVIIPIIFSACSATHGRNENAIVFDKQAHRGGRGLMPENTIASEKNAINYDCTMEMDLQMTKDKKIIVSHDAYFNSDFCLAPNGDTMSKADGFSRLIYTMPYDSVIKYDVGLKPHPGFPQQKKMHAVKPLLSVLIDSVEEYGAKQHHVPRYNIEIKSSPNDDGKTYSTLGEYIDSAMNIIINKRIASRTMMQSFDVRALRIIHEKYPKIKTSFLVDKSNKKSLEKYIEELGFEPDIFSPEFSLVTEDLVNDFHKKHIKIIPWTPDTLEDIQHLKDMGVDGVITDYPNLFSEMK